MRTGSLSSKLAAIGLLIVVVFSVGSFIVKPLWDRYTSNRDLIDELETQFARFQQITGRQSALEQELAKLRVTVERSGLMIEAKSATLASALLQERVKNVVGESGGTLASTQVLVGKSDGAFQNVSVNARMTGSIAAVQSSLHSLESRPPVLVIDDLLIVTRRLPARLRENDVTGAEELDVRFRVTGFYDPRIGRN